MLNVLLIIGVPAVIVLFAAMVIRSKMRDADDGY